MTKTTTPKARFPREIADFPLSQVTHVAHQLGCDAWEAGSYLRGRETIHDLDVVIVVPDGSDMQKVAIQFSEMLFGKSNAGCRIVRGRSDTGLQIDLYLCRPDEAAAMRMFLTGPARFNIMCRQRAQRRGWTLSQYGLFDAADGAPVCDAEREQDIFAALGMDYLEPEARERYA